MLNQIQLNLYVEKQILNEAGKTLLAILSHPRDNELLAQNWPYLKLPGWDVLGVGSADGKCAWPGQVVARLDIGVDGRRDTPAGSSIFGLIDQEIAIWSWFIEHPEYDSVCVMESDSIFTRRPPDRHPWPDVYLCNLMPNFSKEGLFSTSVYAQLPRWSDRKTTEKLLASTLKLISQGRTEHWISDRLPMLACWTAGIRFQNFPAFSPFAMTHWGAGTPDEQFILDARCAIKCGAYVVHSVKTVQHLEALKDLVC